MRMKKKEITHKKREQQRRMVEKMGLGPFKTIHLAHLITSSHLKKVFLHINKEYPQRTLCLHSIPIQLIPRLPNSCL
ncbi:hypothetical protein PIB30_069147 [Stylosanthes scabra]|uniref:Uncharacterized protein n=1 Tax=Stylosanthes scabra TaxID=79078 RepID=A0ABU6WNR4_9FABA|nr:hypothetical protein [Stylosanthes scabra]